MVWNKVTPFSKLMAVIVLLICLPILTFYIGVQYEKTQIAINSVSSIQK